MFVDALILLTVLWVVASVVSLLQCVKVVFVDALIFLTVLWVLVTVCELSL